ncbi:MAG: S1 RNA-binding domain-containing protein [Endomicrobium sp.]|nr:S1 RNA-binding domain-containing protein [Endomicrobium sp.]
MKKIATNLWNEAFKHYKPGSVVIIGIVQNLMSFGAFVRLSEGIEGLTHISDFSWTEKIKHPENVLKKGDEVKGKVISITDFGAFMELESGIKILIKNNEFFYEKSIDHPVLKEGQEVETKIIKVDLKAEK